MEIKEDDVAFHDGVQPVYEPPAPDPSDLEAVLARDPDFLAALENDRFAQAIYAIFQNRTFIEDRSGRAWMCGDRQAAHLVADLRGRGESYHDYYLREFEGTWPDDEASEVISLLKSIACLQDPLSLPEVKFGVGTVVLPDGTSETIRDEAQAREVEARWHGQLAQFWQQCGHLRDEQISGFRDRVATIDRQPNRDVFDRLRAHLARLGWHTETNEDRNRARAAARQRGVEVLQVVKQREARPAGECPSWAKPILERRERQRDRGSFGLTRATALAGLDEDEREVERGWVPCRLDDLAVTGRIGEEEYTDLSGRLLDH
ncbi:hypothetical protein ABZT49_21040 [Methylobacterium sp. EM32]|uniref:hypothetical protein n=1 Tax=Methylobacterium sp. EM32 TaxID=3163481 RepID=UPI0033B33480